MNIGNGIGAAMMAAGGIILKMGYDMFEQNPVMGAGLCIVGGTVFVIGYYLDAQGWKQVYSK